MTNGRIHMENGRLVYYRRNMGRSFWDEHWRAHDSAQFYTPYLKGYIGRGRLPQVLMRWLPRRGGILEAGCGKAQLVVALRARGYDCVGLDNAWETIEGGPLAVSRTANPLRRRMLPSMARPEFRCLSLFRRSGALR